MTPAVPSPVKILRIITRLNVGGPAQHVTFLAERLNEGGFSTSLAAGSLGRGEGDMGPLAARRGITVTFVPELGNERGPIGDLRALLHLYRLVREQQPTVVHLHLLKARFLGGIAARLAGVPLVVETVHGHLLDGYYGPLKTRLILTAERFIARWIVDGVLVLSESQRSELLRRGIGAPEKMHVVPLGLELERFLATPRRGGRLRRELGVPDSTLLVGTVGRLVPIKGYTYLLHAVREVADAVGGSLAVVVVGDGPLRQVLEVEADHARIGHLIKFLGWRSDVAQVYSDLDVFVQPSLNEGTPVSLIEAMAAGTPVVATRVGGVPDVVDDGCSGLLVPARDPSALAQAIVRLWRDPALRQRMGDDARRRVQPGYDISDLVARLQALYLQLLTNRTTAHDRRAVVEKQSIQP